MKKFYWRAALAMTVFVMMAFGAVGVFAQGNDALIRFVHAIPGASAIDVYTDGQLTISGLEYGTASTYVHVPGGDHQLTVTQSGSTTPLWEQTLSSAADSATTLVAASAESGELPGVC